MFLWLATLGWRLEDRWQEVCAFFDEDEPEPDEEPEPIEELLERNRRTDPGCPYCLSGIVSSFDWRRASQDPEDDLERTYVENLEFVRDLKFGRLFRCRVKDCQWHLDVDGSRMAIIEPDVADLLVDWSDRDLLPSAAQMTVLDRIGVSGGDTYGNWAEFRDYPCKCLTKDGEEIDLCIVRIQKTPPEAMFGGRIIFIDDVAHITESDFALSARVREFALQAPEARMSYAPSFIRAPDGRGYTLDGRVYFFDFDGHKGKDMIPARDYVEPDPDAAKIDYEKRIIGFDGAYQSLIDPSGFREYHRRKLTWVIADWTDDYPDPFPYGLNDEGFRSWFGPTRRIEE